MIIRLNNQKDIINNLTSIEDDNERDSNGNKSKRCQNGGAVIINVQKLIGMLISSLIFVVNYIYI